MSRTTYYNTASDMLRDFQIKRKMYEDQGLKEDYIVTDRKFGSYACQTIYYKRDGDDWKASIKYFIDYTVKPFDYWISTQNY